MNRQINYDIYDYIYTDGNTEIHSAFGAKSIQDKKESIIAEARLNPADSNFSSILIGMLFNARTTESRTINIDYRLLNDTTINILKNAYASRVISGIRLVPKGTKLTKELYDKFNINDFDGFLVAADDIDSQIDTESSKLDIINQKEKFT